MLPLKLEALALARGNLTLSERLLLAVADCAVRFARAADWREALPASLEQLGLADDVARVYCYRHEADAVSGHLWAHLVEEWRRASLPAWSVDAAKAQIDLDARSPFMRALLPQDAMPEEERATQQFLVPKLPPAARTFFEGFGVYAMIRLPIVVQGRPWGGLGLIEHARERRWDDYEVKTLHAFTELLGAAIERSARPL